jgi:hypothetical protein
MASTRNVLLAGALAASVAGGVSCTGAPATTGAPARATPAVGAATATTVEWPVTTCGTYNGRGCAATADRVDVERPTFSHPTDVTNPLFPITALASVVLLGEVDGLPFRSETTLLPGSRFVIVDGESVEVVVSQYTAYLDGRIDEVALDRYAQADDGSVWYLGEDVYDYRHGTVAVTEGTWLAGRDGPPAMIMPGDPQVGDVFRAENVIGVVFEEIVVKSIDQTVDGPLGRVEGAVVMQELHLDGSVSDKVFAPGYGEFDTSSEGDVEALALAYPTDALEGVVPADLRRLSTSAWGILENVRLEDWEAAVPTVEAMNDLWSRLQTQDYPDRVIDTLDQAVAALTGAVGEKDVARSSQAAIDVAQSALDLELLYRGTVEVDGFHLHTQQLRVHAANEDAAGVVGEVAALEWIRDRLDGRVEEAALAELDTELQALRGAASARDIRGAADIAARAAAGLRSAAEVSAGNG